jgi:hypothetical protein
MCELKPYNYNLQDLIKWSNAIPIIIDINEKYEIYYNNMIYSQKK